MTDKKIVIGNAVTDGEDRRGWFVGAFIDPLKKLRSNRDVEIKWGIHPKGEERESKAEEGDATTVSILIRGEFQINFTDKVVLLEKEGDYLMFRPNQPHHTKALEESIILTIRWPSLSDKKN